MKLLCYNNRKQMEAEKCGHVTTLYFYIALH